LEDKKIEGDKKQRDNEEISRKNLIDISKIWLQLNSFLLLQSEDCAG
jgi:hypothetical protein